MKHFGHGFRWHRTVAFAMSALFFLYCIYGVWRSVSDPPGIDYVSYWAAARLALEGRAAAAYDNVIHSAVELTVSTLSEGLQPFPYPPPFLLILLPFGLLPFPVSLAAWVAATGALFYVAFRRIAPWPFTFALPAAHMNVLIGQNGLLTSAIFVIGAALLETQPLLGGAILGTLVVKPQLALLLPVAVIASRNWKAMAGAVLSSSALLVLALAVFGPATYQAFFAFLPGQSERVAYGVPLVKLASVGAFAGFFGAPVSVALAIQAVAALAAATATWIAWSRKLSTRIPIVAAATMLVPPYLFTYDALLLLVPLGWLIRAGRAPGLVALIWLFCLLPLATSWGMLPCPNTVPLAAALSVYAMFREARETPLAASDNAAHPPISSRTT